MKISSAVSSFNQVKYLPQHSLRAVYKSLIESRLKYCATMWENCGESPESARQSTYDVITDRENRNHDDCLRVQQLIDQQIEGMVFKFLSRDAPNYLKKMFVLLWEVHTHNTLNHSTGRFPFHTNKSSGQKKLYICRLSGVGIPFLRMFGPLKQ